VFLTGSAESVPSALILHYECNKTLHETIVLLHVATRLVPAVAPKDRATVKSLGQNFYSARLDYGFMEHPNIPKALANLDSPDLIIDLDKVTYFLGRQTILPSEEDTGLSLWREKIYALLSRNATSSTAYFCLPAHKVVEMVTHVEI
jgi:KUP system potassium uptake protein